MSFNNQKYLRKYKKPIKTYSGLRKIQFKLIIKKWRVKLDFQKSYTIIVHPIIKILIL
jgi:hypothetical protein